VLCCCKDNAFPKPAILNKMQNQHCAMTPEKQKSMCI